MVLFRAETKSKQELIVYKRELAKTGQSHQHAYDYHQLIGDLERLLKLPNNTKISHPQQARLIRLVIDLADDNWQVQISNKLAWKKVKELVLKIKSRLESGALQLEQPSQTHARAITNNARLLANNIAAKKTDLINELLKFETRKTAEAEIAGAIHALQTIKTHLPHLQRIQKELSGLSVFLPINIPLYSLILYAIIPGLAFSRVYIRCPEKTRATLNEIIEILDLRRIMPGLEVVDVSRSNFSDYYVSQTDAIIFTGKYENANLLLNKHADKLFIFNGYGINPVVVGADADLDIAVDKVVAMRTFNSGQDCGAPDAILVQNEIYDTFIERLKESIEKLVVADPVISHHDADIASLLYPKQIVRNLNRIAKRKVVAGGLLNFVTNTIYPTIIESQLADNNYQEFFAPIFNLIRYQNAKDLNRYFHNRFYKPNAMYVSNFGCQEDLEAITPESIILDNKVILDIDAADVEFGGYGRMVNYIAYNGKKASFPILIPRDIANCLRFKQPVRPELSHRSAQGLDLPLPKNPLPQASPLSSYQHHLHN